MWDGDWKVQDGFGERGLLPGHKFLWRDFKIMTPSKSCCSGNGTNQHLLNYITAAQL